MSTPTVSFRPSLTADAAEIRRVALLGALATMSTSMAHLTGAIVASVDGLPMAHDLRQGQPESIAAMAATAAGLGKRIVDDFGIGTFEETVVRAQGGYLVVYSAGPMAVLAVIATSDVNLGRLHLEARRCAVSVAGVLR